MVALDLPPAPQGTAPEVALVADPSVRAGVVGANWRLQASSVIERRGPLGGVPELTDMDRFTLDGAPIALSGLPGTMVGVDGPTSATCPARMVRDDNRCLTWDPDANVWIVQRDGWTWVYGADTRDGYFGAFATEVSDDAPGRGCSPDGMWKGPGQAEQTTAWHLSWVEDPSGNRVEYTYNMVCDEGGEWLLGGGWTSATLLKSIRYAQGQVEVWFEYEDRPDWRASAQSGPLRVLFDRLAAIQVVLDPDGAEARGARYELAYVDASATGCPGASGPPMGTEGLSLLQEIDRVAVDGSGERRMLRCMEYEEATPTFDPDGMVVLEGDAPIAILGNSGGLVEDLGVVGWSEPLDVQPVELDGAPWPDLALADRWFFVNDAGTFTLHEALGVAVEGLVAGQAHLRFDVDGDGRTDIVTADGAWRLRVEDHGGLAALVTGWDLGLPIEGAQPVDVNGDGRVDLVFPPQAADALQVHQWIPNLGAAPWFDGVDVRPLALPLDPDAGSEALDEVGALFAACDLTPYPPAGGYDGAPGSATPTGYGEFLDEEDFAASQVRLGDVNGDGVVDAAYALYTCWDWTPAYGALFDAMGGGFGGPTGGDAVFSRVFLGDGWGGFHDSGASAGLPWLGREVSFDPVDPLDPDLYAETWDPVDAWLDFQVEAWTVADLDRSGRPTVLHHTPVGSETSSDMSTWGANAWRGLGEGAGLYDPGSSYVGLDGELPLPGLNEPPLPQARNLVADWDADGYPDILRVRKPEVDADGHLVYPLQLRLYENQLAAPAGRLRSVMLPTGGAIELTWTVSTAMPGNDRVPVVVDVVATIRDAEGLHEQVFKGATFVHGRFRGFRDAQVRDAFGDVEAWRFALSPPLAGLPVMHLVDPVFGTSSLDLSLPLHDDGDSLSLDVAGATFYPVTRQCRTESGLNPGVARCIDAWGGTTPDPRGLALAMGWLTELPQERPSWADTMDLIWAEAAWDGSTPTSVEVPTIAWSEVPDGGLDGVLEDDVADTWVLFEGDELPDRPWAWPALDGSRPNQVPAPPDPVPPTSLSGATRTWITLLDHSGQRLREVARLGDPDDSADDLVETLTWSVWDGAAMGQRLERREVRDSSGRVLRADEYVDFADFDRPGTRIEWGEDLAESRTWSFSWDRGELAARVDPDGGLTTWQRNACGLYTRREDPEHRVAWVTYDLECRETDRSEGGAQVGTTYDPLGRLLQRTVLPSPGSAPIVERHVYDDGLAAVDVRGDWPAPHHGVRYGLEDDDPVALSYLDPWGRLALRTRCEGQAGEPLSDSAVLAELGCVPTTEVHTWQGWAADGTLRGTSLPYAGEEQAAGTWTWFDGQGRLVQQAAPAPAVVTVASEARWVYTTWQHGPGTTHRLDPSGASCTTTTGVGIASLSCEGLAMASVGVDALGRPEWTQGADGLTTRVDYDAFGRPVRTWLDGSFTIEQPDGSAVLVTDPGWSRGWTAGGRLAWEADPLGTRTSWERDLVDRPLVSWVEAADGTILASEHWEHLDSDGISSPVTTWTDGNGNPWTTTRDGVGRLLERIASDGTVESWRHGAFGPERVVHGDGTATRLVRDGLGRVIIERHEAELDATGAPGVWVEWSYDYDARGALVWSLDPDGVETAWDLAWNGAPLAMTRPAPAALGTTWTLEQWRWTDAGQLSWHQQAGVNAYYTYDLLGRPLHGCLGASVFADEVPTGTAPPGCAAELSWSWGDDGRLESRTADGVATTRYLYDGLGQLSALTHADGAVQRWGHDLLGRTTWHLDEDLLLSEWQYDGLGRLTAVWLPGMADWRTYAVEPGLDAAAYDAAGVGLERHQVQEPDGTTWTFDYDFAGRRIWTGRPDGSAEQARYDGPRLAEVVHLDCSLPTCEELAVEQRDYDSYGRLSAVWGPEEAADLAASGGMMPAEAYRVAYGWTDAGRLSTVLGGADEETWFTYESGVLVTEDVVGMTTRSVSYDPSFPRPVSEQLDSAAWGGGTASRQRTFAYDDLGRLITLDEVDDDSHLTTTWADFDPWGTPLSVARWQDGALESALSRATDLRGRLTTETLQVGTAEVGTASFTWTDNGSLSGLGMAWAGGDTRSYTYQRDGVDQQVSAIVDDVAGAALVEVLDRDALGRITDLSLPGGADLSLVRDARGRVEHLAVGLADGTHQSRSYTYDQRGRLSSRSVDGALNIYAWREPGWLATETRDALGASPTTVHTSYDAGGNRQRRLVEGTGLELDETAYVLDGANRLVEVDGAALGWDAFGGVTQDHRGATFTRTADGRTRRLVDPGGASWLDLRRDPLGRPVSLAESSGETSLLMWGNPQGPWPLAGVGPDGTAQQWLALEGMLVAFVEDGAISAAATDPRGDLVLLGEALLGGADAFGATREDALVDTSARYAYAALGSLGDRPQLLAWHRLYDPDLGRFLSADPLGVRGGFHRFTYADNDPLGRRDPAGRSAEDLSWLAEVGSGMSSTSTMVMDPSTPSDWGLWGQPCPAPPDRVRRRRHRAPRAPGSPCFDSAPGSPLPGVRGGRDRALGSESPSRVGPRARPRPSLPRPARSTTVRRCRPRRSLRCSPCR